MKVGDMICVADFHDLCSRQSCGLCLATKLWTLSWTLLQSRRNGIWALQSLCYCCNVRMQSAWEMGMEGI